MKPYEHRLLSILAYNARVLQEAAGGGNPLLERLRFLGIFAGNMHDYLSVRMPSFHGGQIEDTRDEARLRTAIEEQSQLLEGRFQEVLLGLMRELSQEGVTLLSTRDVPRLEPAAGEWLHNYFEEHLAPRIIFRTIEVDAPFPFVEDGATCLILTLDSKPSSFGLLTIPPSAASFVVLPEDRVISAVDVIRAYIRELFPAHATQSGDASSFYAGRFTPFESDSELSADYLERKRRELSERRSGPITFLGCEQGMVESLRNALLRGLGVDEDTAHVARTSYYLWRDLAVFPSLRSDLLWPKTQPAPHPVLGPPGQLDFEKVVDQDVLITYPYQSFEHVIGLLEAAATDLDVQTIKIMLYRVAQDSRVIGALIAAAQQGKRVHVCIELDARQDEERNLIIAERLQQAGAKVIYAPTFKVHAKLLVIERRGVLYAGISTGNFNDATGNIYVDSLLLTTRTELAREVDRVFDYVESATARNAPPPSFAYLAVAPFNFREIFRANLNRERKKGAKGYVLLKVNHLTDPQIVTSLQQAADEGVTVDIIVRTACTMPDHTHIHARSIVDRYLEHQRIFIFGRDSERRVFLGSADLMPRNLDERLEVAAPIYDPALKKEIAEMMELQLADDTKARILDECQSNVYIGSDQGRHRAQEDTQRYLREKSTGSETH